MTIKILHFSDLHLDHAYLGRDAVAGLSRARRAGLRQAFQRALDTAREHSVDAVTIAGDLFEADYLSLETLQFLLEQFRALDPIQAFIAPGNQDASGADSHYAAIEWPRNVHIFREPRLTPLTLRDDWLIWGAGYSQSGFSDPLLAEFRLPTEKPSILLLHGSARDLTWPAGKPSGIPFSFDEVRRAGFQLALLGHRHDSYFADADGLPVCYPGSPEPLSFAEESGHAVWLAEWDAGNWHFESIDISQWRTHTWRLDLASFASAAQIEAHVRGLWDEAQGNKQVVARLILSGVVPAHSDVSVSDMISDLASDLPALRIEDESEAASDFDMLTSELTIRGNFVRRLATQEATDEPTRRLHQAALQHGLKALQGQRAIL